MRPMNTVQPGIGATLARGVSDNTAAADVQAPAAKLTYSASVDKAGVALQRATDASKTLSEGKAQSRSLISGLARRFSGFMSNLLTNVRDMIRPGAKPAQQQRVASHGPNAVRTMGPNMERMEGVRNLTMLTASLTRSSGIDCPAIPRLLHDICAGKALSRADSDGQSWSNATRSRQEDRLVSAVINFMTSPPEATADGLPEISRDEGVVQIAQQLATLLPDQLKSQCAPLLDGLNTANFPERSRQLAAMLQAAAG